MSRCGVIGPRYEPRCRQLCVYHCFSDICFRYGLRPQYWHVVGQQRESAFIRWTVWTFTMTLLRWQRRKHCHYYYFALRRDVKYCDEYVCLSVRSHNSITTQPIFAEFCVCLCATCGHDSVLHGRHCDMLCTSAFVADVTFS